MQITIEIAVKGLFIGERPASHYWRVRWFEDGEEADHIELMDDLEGMQRMARQEGGASWRYYETDVFANQEELQRFLASHAPTAHGTGRAW